ncbi:MAG: NAD(P)H-dependent glycerol-3-phosphate dehydrogenase [Holosporales bacterium]|jgi:glycerol-3-phosphate dehydrogenase (NAD(P)+)|nr:NAD(P)H-dependent glycerol-3-phosphate dehydrogenase [Holosporales bacterium]
MTTRVGVIGAGAFGTSLAICLSDNCDVSLFSFFDDHVEALRATRRNEFLRDLEIPGKIKIDNAYNISSDDYFDYCLWVLPVNPSIGILRDIGPALNERNIIICSKGLTQDGTFLADDFRALLPDSKVGYLSGPNFAIEIATLNPSASDVAFYDMADAEACISKLSNKYLRLLPTDDMIGIQLCGAVKNVIAIAGGIILGLELGQNALAALLSLAMLETRKLGLKLGAQEKTFCGLCGLGDLVLTVSSLNSRNTSLGKKIAEGMNPATIINSDATVYEGYEASKHIFNLGQRLGVEMPICDSVYRILYEKAKYKSIINVLH